MQHTYECAPLPRCGGVRDVSRVTGIPKSTLDKMRSLAPHTSPPFFRLGTRVYYPLEGANSVASWIDARRRESGCGVAA
jgi:hypothetical protein